MSSAIDPITGESAAKTGRQHWCSTSNKQPGCSASSGVCRARTKDAATSYKYLQAQLNRICVVRRWNPVRVTGNIGPDTVKLVGQAFGGGFRTCDAVAENPWLPSAAKTYADNIGAPAVGPEPKGVLGNQGMLVAGLVLVAAWQMGVFK